MLRLIQPEERPPEPAYQVPWHVDRGKAPVYRLRNRGFEPVHGIRLTAHGSGRMLWCPSGETPPNGVIEFSLSGDDLARDTTVTVRWFRPDETEYLWRCSF